MLGFVEMLGAIAIAFWRALARPKNFRLTSIVHHLDRVGWQAIGIILLITFLIGCIIAQQGIFNFRKFGAEDYVVNLVGILVVREIGVLIVAIMVAGRSGSSYTAELGSMKMREEIDALRTMGVDPVEALVLPRVIALIIALPVLTFLGLDRGALRRRDRVGALRWHESAMYLTRLKDAVTLGDFEVGMIKAPVMALIIGVVACTEGLRVKGSAEIARPANDGLGGQIDLSGDRAGRHLRHILRFVSGCSGRMGMDGAEATTVIGVRDLVVGFDDQVVLDHLVARRPRRRDPRRGRRLGARQVGAAQDNHRARAKRSARFSVFGVERDTAPERAWRAIERRWGVLFQQGALFSSLTARENIQFPMRQYLHLSEGLMDDLAMVKLDGRPQPNDAGKFPAELSGGMTKRWGWRARWRSTRKIVFLDEPTSGLDPIAAGEFDVLIRTLQRTLGITVFMVTHDLDSLRTACDPHRGARRRAHRGGGTDGDDAGRHSIPG